MIFYPQRMTEHRHRQLLRDITAIIASRSLPTHIIKVKSHIGIIGNEIADTIATDVAKGHTTPQMEVDEPSNNRKDEYWIHLVKGNAQYHSSKHPPNPLPDLNKHLKQQCHQRHRLGTANQNTIYFSAVTQMNPKLNAQASRKFMTMQSVSERERTNAIKLLSGNLYTNKLAKRFGHTTTDRCPLCKQPDGGSHLAGGCPKLTESYLARHHSAGMYILDAIRAGTKGGTIIQADVGSQKKQIKAGCTPLPSRIPAKHLPPDRYHGGDTQTATKSVPDITLYETEQQGRTTKHRYTIVEIKYCADTRPHPQQHRADQQHTQLTSALTQTRPNTEARVVTILLGMAGYIYQEETEEQLQRLGIQGQALHSLITNLHVQAVKSLTRIIQARRQEEKKQWRKKLRLSHRSIALKQPPHTSAANDKPRLPHTTNLSHIQNTTANQPQQGQHGHANLNTSMPSIKSQTVTGKRPLESGQQQRTITTRLSTLKQIHKPRKRHKKPPDK